MYTRGEIRKIVEQYVITDDGVTHISDMLEEIQNRMFSVIKDTHYYTRINILKVGGSKKF